MLEPTLLGSCSVPPQRPAQKQDRLGWGLYCDRTFLASTSSPGHGTTSLSCLLSLNYQTFPLILLTPTPKEMYLPPGLGEVRRPADLISLPVRFDPVGPDPLKS